MISQRNYIVLSNADLNMLHHSKKLYDELRVEPHFCDGVFDSVAPIKEFGGKGALGILHKSELSQKSSKVCMQFSFPVLNNFLHFFPLSFASFLRYHVCEKKKQHFPRASSGDLLLNEKEKKPFVSISNEVTLIPLMSFYCFVSTNG